MKTSTKVNVTMVMKTLGIGYADLSLGADLVGLR